MYIEADNAIFAMGKRWVGLLYMHKANVIKNIFYSINGNGLP